MNAQPIPLGCAFVCMKFPEGRGRRGREPPFQRGLSPISTNLSKAGSEKREKVKEWDLKKRSGKRSEPDYSRPSTG